MELPFDIVCKKCGKKEHTSIQIRRNPLTKDPPKLAFLCCDCETSWLESGEKIEDDETSKQIEIINKVENAGFGE